ncbi:MAG: threonine ammonia-lyase [Acidimicrobiales bacterium]
MIDVGDIEQAQRRLTGVIGETATTRSRTLSDLSGRDVLLKPEHLQRTGSFKIRGAYNRISTLASQGSATAVVAGSAGNHAQGVALAATLSGLRATVFMPIDAALPKVEATRYYGAEVVQTGESVDDCIREARDYAGATGAFFVPPFDDPFVVAGQGTVGLEIASEAPDAEVVVVPVGGGGLVGGIAVALADRLPRTRVVGVQAAGAACMAAALEHGAPVVLDTLSTLADGIAIRSVSELTLEIAEAHVSEIVTVDEEEISRAVVLLLERCKWVVEPAGAVGLAAVLEGKIPGAGEVAVVLSGGNVDPLLLTRLIEHGMSASGRFVMLRVVIPDRPGALAALTSALAELRLNVLSVDHHRRSSQLAIDQTEVLLTLETRDPEHRAKVVPFLESRGYRVSVSS